MDPSRSSLFDALRGAGAGASVSMKREDVDEISTITGMSMKASRKLLRKYRGNKDDALMAWFEKDVDSSALEAASDSETEDESDIVLRLKVASDWPLFACAVDWIASTSGCTVDLSEVVRPKDHKALVPAGAAPGDVFPAAVVSCRDPQPKRTPPTPEEQEKETFTCLSIGQPVRVRRYQKEMRKSRSGWKEDADLDQRRMCGKIGIVKVVVRRDLAARVEFSGFGSGWWDIRWLDVLPAPLHIASALSCSGSAKFRGDSKQVKLAQRCLSQITTCVRVGTLAPFLGPVSKAIEQVVPSSRGTVAWRTLLNEGEVLGYQLCIFDPRVVGPVARCIEGDVTWHMDKRSVVSEEVVTRVAKLARAKTGCVVVSAPKGETKMDAGALVIRNPRCWAGGNADGLEGQRVAPGVVLGCDDGRAQVFWLNSSTTATHRWGFDDTFDFILMPCFMAIGRLLVVLVGLDRIPDLTWKMLIKVVREALTMDGADLVRTALADPVYRWNGESFAGKIDTGKLARAITDLLVEGWDRDGVLPRPLVSDELTACVSTLRKQPSPVGGHLGIWREANVTVHRYYCSNPSRREGPICQHPGSAIQSPHWSCCGQQARMGKCRQVEERQTPAHPDHPLYDRTMSIMSWVCDRCKGRAEPQQGQRWRCDGCDYDLCDPCLHDSLREVCRTAVELPEAAVEHVSLKTVLDQDVHVQAQGNTVLVTPHGSKPRVAREITFTMGDDGAQPVVTFSDQEGAKPKPVAGDVHGYHVGQVVHATKDIFVSVSVAVHQGGHGTVVGPSTSGDPRRVCVKFLGRDAKINVMPLEVKQLHDAPRRATLYHQGRNVVGHRDATSSSPVAATFPCGSEVVVLEDGKDWTLIEGGGVRGYVRNTALKELNTQSTVVMLNTGGLKAGAAALRSIAARAGIKCNVPKSFELTVGGRLPAVVVRGLSGDMALMNGVYRRSPAEDDCRVIFRKGDTTLYFRGSWWKLNNNRKHDGWLQSSRALTGQWSPANKYDARLDVPYPEVLAGHTTVRPVPEWPAGSPLPHAVDVNEAEQIVYSAETKTLLFDRIHVQAVSYNVESASLLLSPAAPVAVPDARLALVLSQVKALCAACKVPCQIPSMVEVVEAVEPPSLDTSVEISEIARLLDAAGRAHGGGAVCDLLKEFGWDAEAAAFSSPPDEESLAKLARQLHEVYGEKMTADISGDIVAPRSTTVAVVGPHPGRTKAKGFLGRLRDLQEVAIRVPSENHAVVERHRADIQKHAHTHMNVGFGGAIVRLTGTASAIRHTRRAVATLLMKHWREQQRQRRDIVMEQVIASAMEVKVNLTLSPAMHELLSRQEPNLNESQKRHDEAEAERRQDEQRLISMTQELSREYERLCNSCRSQLAAVGMPNVALCTDDFSRGDRVERGPTWQWGDQDGGAGSTGIVLGVHDEDGWVVVEWDRSGKVTRHRTGPLYQDLQHLEVITLPSMMDEGQSDLVTVLKSRVATHMSVSLYFMRKTAVMKLSWSDEEYRQKGIVHEARLGVKEMEAAEKFQSWLRDLFGVKERAESEMEALQKEIEADKNQLAESLLLVRKMEGEAVAFEAAQTAEQAAAAKGELCVCIVSEDQLYGVGNTPFDVCSRKSIPRHSRIRLRNDITVSDLCEAVEAQTGLPPERQRLWYFALQANGTLRPAVMLRRSDNLLLSACDPPPHTPGEVQVLVEELIDAEAQGDSVARTIRTEDGAGGAGGVPFRTAKESQPTRMIPGDTEIAVLEEDAEWVLTRYEEREGWVKRRHVTKAPPNLAIVFLKRFSPEEGTVERLGFRVVDVATTALSDMCKAVNADLEDAADAPLDVYVEESPERCRQVSDKAATLKSLHVRSGSILVFQTPPPPALLRPLKVGDAVIFAGPSHRAGFLRDSEGTVTAVDPALSLVAVAGANGETGTYSDKHVALDPHSIDLPYDHATVPALYSYHVQRRDLPPLCCRAGHPMERIENPRRLVCSYCQAQGDLAFWGCNACDQHLCLLCALETRLSSKSAPELSPRQKPGSSKFRGAKLVEMLNEHAERAERLWQSLAKHRSQLDSTFAEVLMHVRRLGEQRQHRRLFGRDLLLHLMDVSGCLLEVKNEQLLIVGRPHPVQKAVSVVKDMQSSWPPSNLPTEAKVNVGSNVERLFSSAGILAKSLQFECGLESIQPMDENLLWLRGRRESISQATERLKMILSIRHVHVEWAETPSADMPDTEATERCPVCLEDGGDDSLSFACGHIVHFDCGQQYLLAHQFKKESLSCLEAGCKYVLRVNEYAALAQGHAKLQSPAEYYDNLLREALLRHDKVVACPFEGCGGWAVTGSVVGTVENLHCFECDRLFCPICRQRGHFFSQCEDVAEAAKIRAGAEHKQKLEQEEESRKAIAQLCRPCPRCGAQVSRTEGCPHMTCKVCKLEFCYDCLRAIPHFGECDKSKLADRMRRVRAEHGGVMFHKYTKCDICGKHPIPESEEAFTCLNCLHWSLCGSCEKKGKTCGYDGHILTVLPRSDEPPAEAVLKGEKQKWRLKLDEVPYYEIDWDIVRNRQTPLTASSAAAVEGDRAHFEKQVSSANLLKCVNSGMLNPLGTPLNLAGEWGNVTRTSSLLGQTKDLAAVSSLGKPEALQFEWEESDQESGSDSTYREHDSDFSDEEFRQAIADGDGEEASVPSVSSEDDDDDGMQNHHMDAAWQANPLH